jgi:sulfotransferase
MKQSFKQFVCLSGLPRSGSTLISAILSQNPNIHAEGNSGVCQLMWDMYISCNKSCREQLEANNRQNTITDLISSIPHIYYKDINEQIVVDKCRSWTIQDNILLLQKYVDLNIKIIVLHRSIEDIVKSFFKLYKNNGKNCVDLENTILYPNSEPIMRSINGLIYAKNNNQNNNFLFIDYKDIIENIESVVTKIYEFCGWEYFKHDFENIVNKYQEKDDIYGLKGMHEIRQTINIEKNDIKLPKKLIRQCKNIDILLNQKLNNFNI